MPLVCEIQISLEICILRRKINLAQWDLHLIAPTLLVVGPSLISIWIWKLKSLRGVWWSWSGLTYLWTSPKGVSYYFKDLFASWQIKYTQRCRNVSKYCFRFFLRIEKVSYQGSRFVPMSWFYILRISNNIFYYTIIASSLGKYAINT